MGTTKKKKKTYFFRSGGWPDLLMLKTLAGESFRERERALSAATGFSSVQNPRKSPEPQKVGVIFL